MLSVTNLSPPDLNSLQKDQDAPFRNADRLVGIYVIQELQSAKLRCAYSCVVK